MSATNCSSTSNTPPLKKRLFPSLTTQHSSHKFSFLKFNVDGKTNFLIVQNHQLSITTRKYFRYNRWSNSMNSHVSAMDDVAEFKDMMKVYGLFDVGSDGKLLSSFTIMAAKDLECKFLRKLNFLLTLF